MDNEMVVQEQNNEKVIATYFMDMPVRAIITANGEMEWLAKDVCEILDYGAKAETVLRKLHDDEKLMRKLYASGQAREMLFVNEPGLYRLIFRSNKEQAELFQNWVFHEVLPSIRKKGYYAAPEAEEAMLPAIFAKLESLEKKFNGLRINSNTVGPAWSFAHEYCYIGSQYYVGKDDLYALYKDHCHALQVPARHKGHFLTDIYKVVECAYSSTATVAGKRRYVVRGLGLKPNTGELLTLAMEQRTLKLEQEVEERRRYNLRLQKLFPAANNQQPLPGMEA